jgi:hypothetical protein
MKATAGSTSMGKKRKGNMEIIPAIKDLNGSNITDTTEETNILYSYYASVFYFDHNMQEIKLANLDENFIIDTKVIRKKQIGMARWIPGEIMKLVGEAMTPYLARLLETSLNNATIPGDWKKATVFPIYKGGDRSAVSKYRPISLTSVVCKQLEHDKAGYLKQV